MQHTISPSKGLSKAPAPLPSDFKKSEGSEAGVERWQRRHGKPPKGGKPRRWEHCEIFNGIRIGPFDNPSIFYKMALNMSEVFTESLQEISTEQECLSRYANYSLSDNAVFCNATFDSYLCWPPTRVNTVIHQSCPRVRLSDPSNFAYRRCGFHGLWLGRRNNESSVKGWTNFTPCFPTELQSLFEEVFDAKNSTQSKYDIAQITRLIELSGFFASALALIISLGIFSKFRVLRNQRTLIHKCMFWTILAQSLVRIFIYLDQMYFRGTLQRNDVGIEHENNICIICYCVLEYIITATIIWHFIEGVCLFEYVHRNVMRPSFYFRRFFLFGWGIPALITLAWALTNFMYYRAEKIKICWYGYNFLPTYWICQLPRFIIIVINFFFLIGVMRTIIQKLNIATNTELERCRRTVKAAMLLIPLLGIPNILNMIDAPLNLNNWQFALWMYSTHFLISYQGMFIACIYCFANREVQDVIARTWRNARARPTPGVFVIPTGSRNARPSRTGQGQNGQDENAQEPRAAQDDRNDLNPDDNEAEDAGGAP
ncbi:PDF receptor-like [Aricia agestis]|uniref:PDF receptor-like n=1 Tax=Aricia agestis TaxID=91739 RepID=UPI001C2085AA|nr:PDF receptor-like [Aricia agestis]